MKIIIAGAGKIGSTVAALLSKEGHDITLIDRHGDIIAALTNQYDVFGLEGSATNPETLREAGAAEAELLLAATEKDEVNMVCGISARALGTRHVIARVRDPEYLSQTEFLREALGLSVVVNPELECAREIARVLRFPSAARVDAFSKGSLEIVEHRVAPGGKLDGLPLRELPQKFTAKVLVSLVERDGRALIPNGNTVLQAGDRLSLTGTAKELRRFFVDLGQYKRPVRRVMIAGGGRITVYLTKLLEESGMRVTVVEQDPARCEKLCDLIPNAMVICGDATRSDVLLEEGLDAADAFVALTDEDGDNVATSLYAHSRGVSKIVAKVNREHFSDILQDTGLSSIVSPKQVVAQLLTRYARALGNSEGGGVETLYRLADGQVEALEFKVREGDSCVGLPLKNLRLRENVLVCALIRGRQCLIPDGSTVIQPEDHAIVVAPAGMLKEINDMVEGFR